MENSIQPQTGRFGALVRQFGKFVIVGVINTGVDFLVLNVEMKMTGITSGGAIFALNAISFSVATINSYFLNKSVFRENARGCICPPTFPVCRCGKVPVVKLINTKAIVATEDEVKENPRSRSAKLRIIEKI